MKILHTDAFFGFGGGQRRYLSFVNEISKKGVEFLLFANGKNSVVDKFKGKVYKAPFFFDLDIFSFFKFFYIILKEKPDIIHTHAYRDHFFATILSKIFNIPVIHTRHVAFPMKNSAKNRFLFIKSTEKIITISDFSKKMLLKSFDNNKILYEKVKTIKSYVFPEKNGDSDKIRKEFKIKSDAKIVSMITRVVKTKGHIWFLKAIKKIKDNIENVKFFIVGEGDYLNTIKKKAIELDVYSDIIFTGNRVDVENFYTASDIIVYPSEYEGLGVVVLEAIFYNVPIIASDVGGIPELINEGNGVLVKCCDENAIANEVISLLTDAEKYNNIVENMKNWYKKKKNSNEIYENMYKIYEEVING